MLVSKAAMRGSRRFVYIRGLGGAMLRVPVSQPGETSGADHHIRALSR